MEKIKKIKARGGKDKENKGKKLSKKPAEKQAKSLSKKPKVAIHIRTYICCIKFHLQEFEMWVGKSPNTTTVKVRC